MSMAESARLRRLKKLEKKPERLLRKLKMRKARKLGMTLNKKLPVRRDESEGSEYI